MSATGKGSRYHQPEPLRLAGGGKRKKHVEGRFLPNRVGETHLSGGVPKGLQERDAYPAAKKGFRLRRERPGRKKKESQGETVQRKWRKSRKGALATLKEWARS